MATSRPDDLALEQKLTILCRSEIEFVVSPPEAIEDVLKRCGDGHTLLEDVRAEFSLALVRETEQGKSEAVDLNSLGGDAAPVVRLVNETIRAALQKQASDIHIHSDAAGVSVDFRIDGVLSRALGPFDPAYQPTIVSRIKVMADLDIAEHRIPQDGRFRLGAARVTSISEFPFAGRSRRGHRHPCSRQGALDGEAQVAVSPGAGL